MQMLSFYHVQLSGIHLLFCFSNFLVGRALLFKSFCMCARTCIISKVNYYLYIVHLDKFFLYIKIKLLNKSMM